MNKGSIEEDIKILENLIEEYENCSVPEIDMQVNITFGKKEVNAIKTVLGNLEALCDMQRSADRELKRQKQINEEHQNINGELREKVKELEHTIKKINESSSNNEKLIEKLNSGEIFTVNQSGFIKKNFISKQKIKDKFEKIQLLYEKNLKEVNFREVEKIDGKIFEGISLEAQIILAKELLQESEETNEKI